MYFLQHCDAPSFQCDLMSNIFWDINVLYFNYHGWVTASLSCKDCAEGPDRAVCQFWGIDSQTFPSSSVISCLLPSDLLITQAAEIGLANEGPQSLCSYSWLLRLSPSLLSSAAAKLDIRLKTVITLSASMVNEERGRAIDLPRLIHSILNKISKIGRYEANNSRRWYIFGLSSVYFYFFCQLKPAPMNLS